MARRLIASVLAFVLLTAPRPALGEFTGADIVSLIDSTRSAAAELHPDLPGGAIPAWLAPRMKRLERFIAELKPAGFTTLAWRGAPAGDLLKGELASDFDSLNVFLKLELVPAYEDSFGIERGKAKFALIDSLDLSTLQRALARNDAALRNYAIKYGPGSEPLNWVEALFNYALQTAPGFRPGPRGPGPLEFLAGYSSTYATVADEKLQAMSVLEAGLRYYVFAEGWGQGGLAGWLKPRHVSAGLAISGAGDGALRLAGGRGRARLGLFVGWGELKLAYVGGSEERFMLSRQLHVLPNLF